MGTLDWSEQSRVEKRVPFHFVKAQSYRNLSGFEFVSSERKAYICDGLREEKVGGALQFCVFIAEDPGILC